MVGPGWNRLICPYLGTYLTCLTGVVQYKIETMTEKDDTIIVEALERTGESSIHVSSESGPSSSTDDNGLIEEAELGGAIDTPAFALLTGLGEVCMEWNTSWRCVKKIFCI